MKKLIVTGDDFGASASVNEAIEVAHRAGILNTASLMIAGAAADDAVQRAKRMSSLRVGLHVVVVDGRPLLDPQQLPALVDERGEFPNHLVRRGFRFFLDAGARRQLAAEIRAQFEAFEATGLRLDHVNGHNHMHLHPTVLGLILAIGQGFGIRAVRLPYEPFLPSWRAARADLLGRFDHGVLLWPMLGLMRRRLQHKRIAFNDFVFGLNDSGRMTSERVLQLLRALPDGITEMYFHPATARWPGMPGYARCEEELQALTNPVVRDAIADLDIAMTTFGELHAN